MTLFGLDPATVLSLALGVRDGDDDDASQTFARAAWSGIAEPGDGAAGFLVGGLGPVDALSAVLDGWSPERLAAACDDHGGLGPGLRDAMAQGLERWRPRLRSGDVVRSMQQAERVGARLIVPGDPLWPHSVGDLGSHAPLALWWRGTPDALTALGRAIALVGARAATGYGEHVAMEAAAGLVDRGYAIVSGAAYGIDGMAHRSALASSGQTVAFLAGGVDRFYPSGHDGLLTRMAEVGAVIAELPCGSSPTKWRFLQRNRLIAAASSATVVLEAGKRSGSLNTAGHAAALGRPLGAVPGPITSPTSAGCHRLIREFDAVCVTDADEMAELAEGWDAGSGVSGAGTPDRDAPAADELRHFRRALGIGGEHMRVLDALSKRSPRSVPDIAARAGLSTSAVLAVLGDLTMEGTVAERENGWVR